MLESIFNTVSGETTVTPLNFILAISISLALGLLVSIVYMKTHNEGSPSQSFSLTLVILPVVVTVIIMLIGNSVARAFSWPELFKLSASAAPLATLRISPTCFSPWPPDLRVGWDI